jgi:hypothetical protein
MRRISDASFAELAGVSPKVRRDYDRRGQFLRCGSIPRAATGCTHRPSCPSLVAILGLRDLGVGLTELGVGTNHAGSSADDVHAASRPRCSTGASSLVQ